MRYPIDIVSLLLSFSPQLLIGGAALANWIQMGPKRHPSANRPLISYDLALLMQPLALAGTRVMMMMVTMTMMMMMLMLMC